MADAATIDNTHTKGIGTTYMYNDPATVKAATINKIQVLNRTDPSLAQYAQSFFDVDAGIPKSTTSAKDQSLDKYSRNLFQTTFSQELSLAKKGEGSASKKILDFFKPISSHIGSTLGNQNGVQSAPFLGTPSFLSSGLNSVVNKVSTGLAASMDAAHKKYKLDTTQHSPSQVQGSPSSVAVASKPNASSPLVLISDTYNGVQSIVKNKAGLVDDAKKVGITFATGLVGGLLDGLTSQVTSPLLKSAAKGTVSTLKNASSSFLGTQQQNALTNSVQNQSTKLGGALQNPLTVATHYIPKQVTGTAAFNAPLSIASSYLPSALSTAFSNPQGLTGFGNSGNLGYALQPALQAVQGQAVSSAIGKYGGQLAILSPLLNLGANVLTSSLSPLSTTPPAKKASTVNTGIVVAQGVPQSQVTPTPVLPTSDGNPTASSGLTISSPINNGLVSQPINPSQVTIKTTF